MLESKNNYYVWLFAIWSCMFLGQCSQQGANRDIVKELREIKMEIKYK